MRNRRKVFPSRGTSRGDKSNRGNYAGSYPARHHPVDSRGALLTYVHTTRVHTYCVMWRSNSPRPLPTSLPVPSSPLSAYPAERADRRKSEVSITLRRHARRRCKRQEKAAALPRTWLAARRHAAHTHLNINYAHRAVSSVGGGNGQRRFVRRLLFRRDSPAREDTTLRRLKDPCRDTTLFLFPPPAPFSSSNRLL